MRLPVSLGASKFVSAQLKWASRDMIYRKLENPLYEMQIFIKIALTILNICLPIWFFSFHPKETVLLFLYDKATSGNLSKIKHTTPTIT